MNTQSLIKLQNVDICFSGQKEPSLKSINMEIKRGDFMAIIGPSGAGKSTLMRTLCGFLKPSKGKIQLLDENNNEAPISARQVSMIFQNFHLVESMNVLTNVLVGRLANKKGLGKHLALFDSQDRHVAIDCLDKVNMQGFIYRKVSELSGGQKQRVAIARALAQGARLLLADEPVASLDPINAINVIELLKELNSKHGITVAANMHQIDLVEKHFEQVLGLQSGRIQFHTPLNNKEHTLELSNIYT